MSIQTQLVCSAADLLLLVSCFPASTNTAASCAALVRCLARPSTRPLPWLLGPEPRARETRDNWQEAAQRPHISRVCCPDARSLYNCVTVQLYTHSYVTWLKLCSFLTFLLLLLFLSWNFNIETYIVLMMDGCSRDEKTWEINRASNKTSRRFCEFLQL